MKKIRVGIIPAAGKGSRLNDLQLTRILPKGLLPLLNKPILEYIVETLKDLGVEEIYLVVGHKKNLIMDYFGDGQGFGVQIKYLEQPVPLGIADAISRAEGYVNEPFIVVLGDSFFVSHNLSDLLEAFWTKKALAVEGIVVEKSIDALKRACNVILDSEGRIIEIYEKPQCPTSSYRGIGSYIFDPIVFQYIKDTPIGPPRGEREITNTIKLMSATKQVYGVMINGVEININTLEDLKMATNLLLKNGKN